MSSNLNDLIVKTRELNTYFEANGSPHDKKDHALEILEEAGEMAQALLITEGVKFSSDSSKQKTQSDIIDGLSDMLFSMINLADKYDMNLFEDYERMLVSLEARIKSGEFKRR